MDYEIEKVNIKPVDYDKLEMLKEGTDKVKVILPIDREPSHEWKEIFWQQVKKYVEPVHTLRPPRPPKGMRPIADPARSLLLKYPIDLGKGAISIIASLNQENVHEKILLVKQLVNNTNEQVNNANRENMQKIKAKEMQDKKEKEALDKIRDYLKKNPP